MDSPYTSPSQQPQRPQMPPQPGQQDATGGVIPYKNVPALLSYYFGIFSLIPGIGLLLGPAAFICGIIGFRAYCKDKRKRGQVHAWVGIILGTLVTLGHIALVLMFFIGSTS